jgi:hypothetical protein
MENYLHAYRNPAVYWKYFKQYNPEWQYTIMPLKK